MVKTIKEEKERSLNNRDVYRIEPERERQKETWSADFIYLSESRIQNAAEHKITAQRRKKLQQAVLGSLRGYFFSLLPL